jgi:N-methylhydantoinase A
MTAEKSAAAPVNLLMSGPAGGVAGAVWIARNAGFPNVLTLDMGGTSTDVALIENHAPRLRRETSVGHLTVRASSLDVKTVGAGGGSIASVPELTKALRVGPQSAGAVPGPAAYGRGGELPTVTDANVVLGYLPENLLGGAFRLDREASRRAVQTVADALGLSLMAAAQGIVSIVNETMFGALRLVSVSQGYDPRDFALMAFGGAGPLHGNAMGILMGSWPVIVPPSPGILCAYGDATTRLRVDAQRSFNRLVTETNEADVGAVIETIVAEVTAQLAAEGVPRGDIELQVEIDTRYAGQAFEVPLPYPTGSTIADLATRFDAEHLRLFTFNLPVAQELVNIRVVALGKAANVTAERIAQGNGDPAGAKLRDHALWMDGREQAGAIYDRARLKAGDRVAGPAIVCEMDSTTLVHSGHVATVDPFGNILIGPA